MKKQQIAGLRAVITRQRNNIVELEAELEKRPTRQQLAGHRAVITRQKKRIKELEKRIKELEQNQRQDTQWGFAIAK